MPAFLKPLHLILLLALSLATATAPVRAQQTEGLAQPGQPSTPQLRKSVPDPTADCVLYYKQQIQVDKSHPEGPRVFMPAETTGLRPLSSYKSLIFATFNVLNLSESKGKWHQDPVTGERTLVEPPAVKPEFQQDLIAQSILRSNADFIVLQEVDNLKVLLEFIERKLGGKYRAILIEGNDERGIDTAGLIKKGSPFDVEFRSHRNVMVEIGGKMVKLHSRDSVEMLIWPTGMKGKVSPLGFREMHNKSQRQGPTGPRSEGHRGLQIGAIVADDQALEAEFGPIITVTGGDGNVDTFSEEWKPLIDAGFANGFLIAPLTPPRDQWISHTFITDEGPHYSLMDTFFLNPTAQKAKILRRMGIQRYYTPKGKLVPYATTSKQRDSWQGSDHFLVEMEVDGLEAFKYLGWPL